MAKRSRKRSQRTSSTASSRQEDIVLEPEPLDVASTRTPPPDNPSHHFRILRPSDLVVLDVIGFGLEHAVEEEQLVLRPVGGRPRLEVRYTFQHLLEAAEPEMESPPPFTPVPIPARAAYGSRLVFDVPDDERIEYSVAGVLAAISRLPLSVAPLATPRVLPRRFTLQQFGDRVVATELPGGFRLFRTELGLVLAPPEGDSDAADESGARRLIAAATGLRTARTLLSTERGIDLSGIDLGVGKTGFDRVIRVPGPIRRLRQRPRAPRVDETAIEAPFRLILSPSSHGGFAHATMPRTVLPDPERHEDPERVELWHSRLGVRHVDADGVVTVDEAHDPQKAVRAIWARDADDPAPDVIPFIASLVQSDREALVRQSADPAITRPEPVDVERLYLTALGAWLELHGRWNVEPYTSAGLESVVAWDHEGTVGRDNFVRVVKPYYLFPFGHRCQLITITERKIKETKDPQARLFQRKFIAVQEPVRTFDSRTMPLMQVRLRPLITPNLDFQLPPPFPPDVAGSVGSYGDDLFWPTVGGSKYRFALDCLDHNGRRVVVRAALLAVGAHLGSATEKSDIVAAYTGDNDRRIDGDGQMVAMAASTTPGDTAYETAELRFTGDPGDPGDQTSDPHLEEADIIVPAMRHLAPSSDAVTVHYAQTYLNEGFGGANATPQVLLELNNMTSISFGGGTDDSGGFVQPDLPVRGLSRKIGVVGDIDSVVNPPSPAEAFDPTEFLAGVLPKLFGLFELTDILALAGLDKAPSFVTDQLDKIAALLADLEELAGAIDRAIARLTHDAANAPTTALQDQADAAKSALEAVQASYATRVQNLQDAIDDLLALDAPSDLPAVTATVGNILDDLAGFVTDLQEVAQTLPLPPTAKAELERLTGALQPLLEAGQIADTIGAIADFVNGIDPSNMAVRARFAWRPTLSNFPASATSEDDALFFVDPNGFVLSVEARASGGAGVGADVLAELSDFGLNLFPGEPLIKIRFDRLAFRASSGRKPEVDVVFTGLEWQGILAFIETLQELIPFDGFSDPPYVDVGTEGITAGFDLGLPAVSVGVFSLENISLGADVRVPFLGDAVTVGFNFCTREKPFRLTVMMIGGGGFVGIRLSPKGLVVLEMALEAGASLSIDLGVASGSVSIMVGIYMKLESDAGSLTGYFRIRGEVDVLGLISASITLELSLTYEFDTGKMVGRASITIEIEVFIFSGSVQVSCERRLAGSNGDPTLAQILGVPEDGTPVTDVPPAWSTYCSAFAGS